MKLNIEQKLWNLGKENESYTKEDFYEIIDALLDDFQEFMGHNFKRDTEIYLDTKKLHSPSFCRWMWTMETEKSPLSTVWLAVIGGDMVGTENGDNVFHVSLTLFLFDAISKKRLCLTTGESVIEFVFERQSNSRGCWRSFGWCKDEWGEWEDIKYE
ncbi:hypothetical protein H6G80_31615 [Nostoc sp. FACHB-87]|uniref:hypothetical protein n=1 Tax=Nostocales TaxID=1161 RepID=UPI00168851F6|nr:MULTISPECIES: hypothetical protein [Nostocales]MBD2299835.1 hypothetical protein [Nostoc sp. FACHB-190]MBD2458600.1 hypothetical protein [Nostoc sp. FACHB-87]MBD2479742.1 hypothetical protein [Anabaena sp. FACHB-83]MBD2490052.1 hypothetical protein [Aulosira sp. FACHB-615]